MSDVVQHAENIIYDWIISLPNDDIENISNSRDILEAINEEAEQEIKNDLWNIILNSVDFSAIMYKIKLYAKQNITFPDSDLDSDSD